MHIAGVTARLGYALMLVLTIGATAAPDAPRDQAMTPPPLDTSADANSMELLELLEMFDLLELLETPEIWDLHNLQQS